VAASRHLAGCRIRIPSRRQVKATMRVHDRFRFSRVCERPLYGRPRRVSMAAACALSSTTSDLPAPVNVLLRLVIKQPPCSSGACHKRTT
jgi:hypothetical protein